MVLSQELLALFAAKSKKKKLFFSTWQGRRQMAMRLDTFDGGQAHMEASPLLVEIGGKLGRKTKRPPIGIWEWYYQGKDLLAIVAQLHPILNWYQQRVTAPWIADQPDLPLNLAVVTKPKKLTAKQRYYLEPGDDTWRAAWDECRGKLGTAVSGSTQEATGQRQAGGGDGSVEAGSREPPVQGRVSVEGDG